MPNTLPSFTPPNLRKASEGHVVWTANRKGVINQVLGSPGRVEGMLGLSVWALSQDCPPLAKLFRTLYAGEAAREFVPWSDGTLWVVEARPTIGTRGRVIGALGTSWLLEPDTFPAPVEFTREREWRMRGLPAGQLGPFRNGDRFLKVDGIAGLSVGRRVSDGDFLGLYIELGELHFELIRDSAPPTHSLGHGALRLLR
jgi:hypothetical protein